MHIYINIYTHTQVHTHAHIRTIYGYISNPNYLDEAFNHRLHKIHRITMVCWSASTCEQLESIILNQMVICPLSQTMASDRFLLSWARQLASLHLSLMIALVTFEKYMYCSVYCVVVVGMATGIGVLVY